MADFGAYITRFIRGHQHRGERVTLNRKRIFILPTGQGLVFALALFVMLLGAINYSNSMAFLLVFLLGSLAMVSILHTHRNLAGLSFHSALAQPVVAGSVARFVIVAEHSDSEGKWRVELALEDQPPISADIAAGETARLELPLATIRRGWLRPGRVTVSTRFPLGLFRAWAYLDLDLRCLVYPAPGKALPLPPPAGGEASTSGLRSRGGEDFSGLRAYVEGDSPRHVHWKALAHGGEMVTKQFAGGLARLIWLDWDSLRELSDLDYESRIGIVARWVLEAGKAGLMFGLRLPGTEIAPAQGPRHESACLRALALLPQADSAHTKRRWL